MPRPARRDLLRRFLQPGAAAAVDAIAATPAAAKTLTRSFFVSPEGGGQQPERRILTR
jgi:hypothetical protein